MHIGTYTPIYIYIYGFIYAYLYRIYICGIIYVYVYTYVHGAKVERLEIWRHITPNAFLQRIENDFN